MVGGRDARIGGMGLRWWLLGFVAGLVGCSSDPAPQVVAPDSVDVTTLRVVGREPVGRPGVLTRLSPDGSRLLSLTRPGCVTALDGSDERCVNPATVVADLDGARWSPDGTKLVFTEPLRTRAQEPDVWVFDAASATLRNVTDDHRNRYSSATPDPDMHLDVLPSWSPDGRTVRFARGHVGEPSVQLMSVPVEGGQPTPIGILGCRAANLYDLAWSTDQLAWLCQGQNRELWLASKNGTDPRNVLPGSREDLAVLSFSPDGQWLLVDSSGRDGNGYTPGDALVIPTAGRSDPRPVADGLVAYPTWSPTGHAIAYVESLRTLSVVAEPGAQPHELDTAQASFSAPDAIRLQWIPGKLMIKTDTTLMLLNLAN